MHDLSGVQFEAQLKAIVDAHHHLWSLGRVSYPWLEARGVRRFFGDPTPIQRDYRVADFRADHGDLPVVQSVHVQVGAAPGAEVDETRWLDREADMAGLPSAIVAYADLASPDLGAILDAHRAASPRLRGVRQIVARHPEEDARTGAPDLLADPAFLRGLRVLAERGLSFDLQLTAPLLSRAAALFGEVPDLAVALCHCGSPWDRSPEGLRSWREGLRRFAALPRATVKISGLGMFDPGWTPASLRPIVEGALAAFGPDRAMWGSNFPVDKLYRGYGELFDAVAAIVPEKDRPAVFAGTARRFYRL